jgi:hypothetical protein
MPIYTISHKTSGVTLYETEAESAEAALLAMEADLGPIEVTVIDDTKGVDGVAAPEEVSFSSYADALKVFTPEALATFTVER